MNERYYLQKIQFRYFDVIRCEVLIYFPEVQTDVLIGVRNGLSGIEGVSVVEVVNEYPDVNLEFIRNETISGLAPVNGENRLNVFLKVDLKKAVEASEGTFASSQHKFSVKMNTDNPLDFNGIPANYELFVIEVSI